MVQGPVGYSHAKDSVICDVGKCNVRQNLRQICLKDVCQLFFHCTLSALCSSTSEDLSKEAKSTVLFFLCYQINVSDTGKLWKKMG